MKKLLVLILLIGFTSISFGQKKRPEAKKITRIEENDTLSTTDGWRDPSVFVYKCIDPNTNETIYIDLLELGYVSFMVNEVVIRYKVHMYSLLANDTAWIFDYVSIKFQGQMPIESIQFNSSETKLTIFVNSSRGPIVITTLDIVDTLAGFAERKYIKKKKKYPSFTYGDDDNVPIIRYEH